MEFNEPPREHRTAARSVHRSPRRRPAPSRRTQARPGRAHRRGSALSRRAQRRHEEKRAGLARALALDPRIVFCDEPSAGLDPLSSRQLDDLLRQLRDSLGTTMVVVSHEPDSIFGIGERLVVLDKAAQGMVALGRPAELAADPAHPAVRDFLTRGGARSLPQS